MDWTKLNRQNYPFRTDGNFCTNPTYFLDENFPTYDEIYLPQGECQYLSDPAMGYPRPHSTTTESGSEGYIFDTGSSPSEFPSKASPSPCTLQHHDFDIEGPGIDFTDQEIWEWEQSNPLDSIPNYPPSLLSLESPESSQACPVPQIDRPLLPRPEAPVSQQAASPPVPVEAVKLEPRRRRRKNPADLRKNQRKQEKPEKCPVCGKGHAENRALERHIVSNHRHEAIELGLDVSKIQCPYCPQVFDKIRKDRLTRHVNTQHPELHQNQYH